MVWDDVYFIIDVINLVDIQLLGKCTVNHVHLQWLHRFAAESAMRKWSVCFLTKIIDGSQVMTL